MNKKVESDYINFYIINNKIELIFCNRTLGAKKIGVSPTMINMYKSGDAKTIKNGHIISVNIEDVNKVMFYLLKYKNKETVIR